MPVGYNLFRKSTVGPVEVGLLIKEGDTDGFNGPIWPWPPSDLSMGLAPQPTNNFAWADEHWAII